MNTNDPGTMVIAVSLVTLLFLSVGLTIEHQQQQEALALAYHYQTDLDHCIQDKNYSNQADQRTPTTHRDTATE